jgi:hypothetical protein
VAGLRAADVHLERAGVERAAAAAVRRIGAAAAARVAAASASAAVQVAAAAAAAEAAAAAVSSRTPAAAATAAVIAAAAVTAAKGTDRWPIGRSAAATAAWAEAIVTIISVKTLIETDITAFAPIAAAIKTAVTAVANRCRTIFSVS